MVKQLHKHPHYIHTNEGNNMNVFQLSPFLNSYCIFIRAYFSPHLRVWPFGTAVVGQQHVGRPLPRQGCPTAAFEDLVGLGGAPQHSDPPQYSLA